MTRHISLQEANDIINTLENPMDAANHPELLTFVEDIDKAGTDALEKVDEEYIASAVGLMMSNSVVKACENIDGTVDFLKMIKLSGLLNSDDFQNMMIAAFKFVVGLSALEELR